MSPCVRVDTVLCSHLQIAKMHLGKYWKEIMHVKTVFSRFACYPLMDLRERVILVFCQNRPNYNEYLERKLLSQNTQTIEAVSNLVTVCFLGPELLVVI